MTYRARGWIAPLDHVHILTPGDGGECYAFTSGFVIDIFTVHQGGRFLRAARVLQDDTLTVQAYPMRRLILSGKYCASDDYDDCYPACPCPEESLAPDEGDTLQ
jgi:hypothetical protein